MKSGQRLSQSTASKKNPAATLTLEALLQKFLAVNRGRAPKTQATDRAIVNVFRKTWRPGLDIDIRDILPSHLNEWLAQHEGRLKHSTYNRYTGFLRQLFEIVVADRLIAESPFAGVRTKWKRPQKPVRNVPTLEEFYQIVDDLRARRGKSGADQHADFVQFLGEAGVGQAEAESVTKGDVDWSHNRICIRRRKTQAVFYIPIYPHLNPLLEKLESKLGRDAAPGTKLFKINNARKALAAACRRLGFKHFTHRNIRQVLIRRLWQCSVDYKLIAKWQGHQDGGKLILDTYTEVFCTDQAAYEAAQLTKIR